jgi:hypothetical protein
LDNTTNSAQALTGKKSTIPTLVNIPKNKPRMLFTLKRLL